jgi:hypothetical protein
MLECCRAPERELQRGGCEKTASCILGWMVASASYAAAIAHMSTVQGMHRVAHDAAGTLLPATASADGYWPQLHNLGTQGFSCLTVLRVCCRLANRLVLASVVRQP